MLYIIRRLDTFSISSYHCLLSCNFIEENFFSYILNCYQYYGKIISVKILETQISNVVLFSKWFCNNKLVWRKSRKDFIFMKFRFFNKIMANRFSMVSVKMFMIDKVLDKLDHFFVEWTLSCKYLYFKEHFLWILNLITRIENRL